MTSFAPQTASFAALADNLAPARNFLRHYVTASGWDGSDLDAVIAIGEVLQNIVRHGFGGGSEGGRIMMTAHLEERVLTVTIDDTAPPSMPEEWGVDGRETHEGGLGLGLIDRIASEASFQSTDRGNRATLRFLPCMRRGE